MYQSDRGNYSKKDSLLSLFWHSCLGKIVILGGILGILALIAAITCPSEKNMSEQMSDNIRQCLERSDSVYMDGIDNALANIGYIFSTAKTTGDTEMIRAFKKHNRLEYYNHGIFSTMYVFNNFHYEGIRCGIGIFGIVIPLINFNDLVLRTIPIRKEYNYRPVEDDGDEEFYGSTDDGEDFIFKEMDSDTDDD